MIFGDSNQFIGDLTIEMRTELSIYLPPLM